MALELSKSRGVQLVLLTVAAFAGIYARFTVSPLQEAMRAALALSDNQMALLQGPAFAFPMAIAAIPVGIALDRYSRTWLMSICVVLVVIGSLLTVVASRYDVLLAARCLVGFASTVMSMCAYCVLADLYAPSQRGRAGMVVAIGEVAGAAAAFALGGALLVKFGSVDDRWRWALGSLDDGWRWALGLLSAPLVLLIGVPWLLREPARVAAESARPGSFRALAEIWRYRATVMPLLIARIMVGVADGAALIWAAPTFSRDFGIAPDRVGAIMAAVLLVSGIAGPVLGGTVADLGQRSGGPRRTLSLLGALAIVSTLAGFFAVAPGTASSSVLLVVFVTVASAITVTVMAVLTVVLPSELRGTGIAILFSAGLIFGVGLAPLAVSVLSDVTGASIGSSLAAVCVSTSLLGALAFAAGLRRSPTGAVA